MLQFRPPIKRTGNLRGSQLLGRRGVWGNLLCVSAAKSMRCGRAQHGANPPMTARVRPPEPARVPPHYPHAAF